MSDLKTVDEAATVLKLSSVTVRAHIQRGNLQAKKLGRDWLLDEAELTRFQQERRKPGYKTVAR